MTITTSDIFEGTLRKTDAWLHEIGHELGWEDPRGAYLALRAVLHALRDRLLANEAADLGAQLPMLVRGLYYQGWKPTNAPRKERHKEQFLAHILHEFRKTPEILDAEPIARAVFKVLADRVTAGEIDDVRHMLPPELRELWP